MKVIDQNGNVQFRGEIKAAKRFFGDGTLQVDVFEGEETISSEVLTLELVYEATRTEDLQYLADTDWYVTREQETGKAIPVEVKAKRSKIRVRL